jgi:hypothetical protein
MRQNALGKSLAAWAATALRDGRDQAFDLHPRFRIPGAGTVDLLTVRRTADRIAVGLWSIDPGAVGDAGVDAMARRLHAFEAWYSELREHAETRGFSPVHRIMVCGNLVGRSVRRSPLVSLLSNWGGAICFWTWRKSSGGLEVTPYYSRQPALGAARAELKAVLHDLPWQDTVDRDVEKPAELSRRV